ncbi:hypothetical protein ARALYDRAFT_331780 [Arabidopsis lyrata subsp. lyrata]|uniref:Uncharacterized protein n=1 Tax=Arabidopsis lyrata subsp. lyrata TaxID=81972 RepID=D7MU82_ARALL|nr:hypothetical protein ARALYDRAFT_331780 [Arabidopsis lyrata subsp. lyrata]
MENQSMSSSSSSSSPQKPDQKLKSPVVTVEEKETRNNPEQRSPQEVVAENTILELPTFGFEVVRTKNNTVLYRGSSYKRKMTDSMPSGGTSLAPFQSFPFLSSGPFMYGQGGSSYKMILILISLLVHRLSPQEAATIALTHRSLGMCSLPCVLVCLDTILGNGSGFSPSKSLFLMAQNKAMMPPFASPYPTTNLYNGMGSSHSKSLISMEKNIAMVPPFATPSRTTTDLSLSLQENGSGSSNSKSLISKGGKEVVVIEDDDDDDDEEEEDIVTISWLNKKKRSRRE